CSLQHCWLQSRAGRSPRRVRAWVAGGSSRAVSSPWPCSPHRGASPSRSPWPLASRSWPLGRRHRSTVAPGPRAGWSRPVPCSSPPSPPGSSSGPSAWEHRT
ncbi:MAG: hypothetical protein AVDCRST_MAG18-1398, partial [uncultured Thermomicrobiales bacterium]